MRCCSPLPTTQSSTSPCTGEETVGMRLAQLPAREKRIIWCVYAKSFRSYLRMSKVGKVWRSSDNKAVSLKKLSHSESVVLVSSATGRYFCK